MFFSKIICIFADMDSKEDCKKNEFHENDFLYCKAFSLCLEENFATTDYAKKYLGADASAEALEARMDRMDRAVLILKKPVYGMKAELLLIDEDLGF